MNIYTTSVVIFIIGFIISIIVIVINQIEKNKNREKLNQKNIDRFKHVLLKKKFPYKKKEVPKKIYRLWCTKEKRSCGGRDYNSNPWEKTNISMGDNFNQEIITDAEYIPFLEKHFGKNHKVIKALSVLNPKYGAARADLMRYAIMYIKGGIYLDFKSCIIKKLPDMPDHIDMMTFRDNNAQTHLFPKGEIINWFLYVRKKSPIMLDILNTCIFNILYLHKNLDKINEYNIAQDTFLFLFNSHSKSLTLNITGPIMLTNVIENSKYRYTVLIDQKINDYVKYMCQPNNIFSGLGKKHYSKQKEPIVISK